MKKAILGLILPFFLVSILSAQSLAELSKKEKARREALKGKQAILITNIDLGKTQKKAGLMTPPPTSATNTQGQPIPEAEQPESYVPAEEEPGQTDMSSNPEANQTEGMADGYRASLEAQYAKAKEYADLLELKMAALWQQFYNLDDMTTRDSIQQEIALTFDKLGKAREEENSVKKDLDNYSGRIRY